jgi:nucleotide-binding universal stress UspA family protein
LVKVKKILVTTDLSEESRSAMEFAVWLSLKESARITLLYCVDNLPTVAYHTVDLTFDKFREEIMLREQKQLNKFSENSEKTFKTSIRTEMIEGNAPDEIVDFASKNNFDLIVMNTHGRTGIQHAMVGSVAEKVVRKAHCPVLTIRSTVPAKQKKFSTKK